MIPVAEAEKHILDRVCPFAAVTDSEMLPLAKSLGRILAEDLSSPMDFPHWDNSAMDGYALCHADLTEHLAEGRTFHPLPSLTIAATEIPAGAVTVSALARGTCVRIFTGGQLPEGADTVVMQEDTERSDDRLYLKTIPKKGEYVRARGSYAKIGDILLRAGIPLGASELGAIAAAHCQQVRVYRQPKVAIFSTGNELVNVDSSVPLQPGQIIDSNQHTIAALVAQAGAIPLPIAAVLDNRKVITQTVREAIARTDLIISSGGVSVGDYDYVGEVLASLGAEICVRSVAIKPGKPLTVASFPASEITQGRSKLYFGVPGNPVSAMVSFWRFIRGAIAKLSGASPAYWYPQFVSATTKADLHAQGRRETYLWGKLLWHKGEAIFEPVRDYSSGNLISILGANAIAVLRVNQTYVPEGDRVLTMLIDSDNSRTYAVGSTKPKGREFEGIALNWGQRPQPP